MRALLTRYRSSLQLRSIRAPQAHMVGLISGQMKRGRRFMKSHFSAFLGTPGAAQGDDMP